MKLFKKRIAYFISALWYAFVFFWLTTEIFYGVANGNVLYATIWNTAIIVFLVIWNVVEENIYIRIKPKDDKAKISIMRRIGLMYFGGATFKTSLYLFYFVMLICNALVTADPEFPFLYQLTDYFKSVYYGILILFAADTFLTRLLDDVQEKRIEKMIAKLNLNRALKMQNNEPKHGELLEEHCNESCENKIKEEPSIE